MRDPIDFLAIEYFGAKTAEQAAQIRALLTLPGVFVHGTPEQGCVSVFVRLSDFGVSLVEQLRTDEAMSIRFILNLLRHPGDHLMFVVCVASGVGSIRKELRAIIKEHTPASVMWVDPNRVFLHRYGVGNVKVIL